MNRNLATLHNYIAALNVWSDYQEKTNIEYGKIVHQKVDLLTCLVNSLHEQNVQMEAWLTWSEPMLYKLIFHASSFLKLFNGTEIYFSGKEIKIFDEPSVLALFRIILENYLTFYYIFCDDIIDDEKKFRILVWQYCGIKQRTDFDIFTEDAKKKQATELIELSRLKEDICNSKYFSMYKNSEQKEILKGVKPRLFYSWQTLIKKSRFKIDLFKNLYGYKSNYMHSEFISVFQIKSKGFGLNLEAKEHFTLFLVHGIICKSIIELQNLFPPIKTLFESQKEELRNEIKFLYNFLVDV